LLTTLSKYNNQLSREASHQTQLWERIASSCDKGIGLLGLVSPCWWEGLGLSVVSCKSMNSGFDENQSEFSVSVCSELLNMLSNIDGFFDKMIEIFWEAWCDSGNLKNSKNLLSCNRFDLWNTVLISENNTNLRRRRTSFGHLDDLF